MNTPSVRVAFICVQNAGRSQMATALAKQERQKRGVTDEIAILTGGTHPADSVHDVVIEVMEDDGFDLSDRTPREITTAELESCDYVATMGCSTLELDADNSTVDVRDWGLDDPDGKTLEEARDIRDTVHRRVQALFDDIEREMNRDE